jgi:hypothetical protein
VSCVHAHQPRGLDLRLGVRYSALALRSIVFNSGRIAPTEEGNIEDAAASDVPTAGYAALYKHIDRLIEIYREPVLDARHSSAGARNCLCCASSAMNARFATVTDTSHTTHTLVCLRRRALCNGTL